MREQLPRRFGPFILTERLGRGGMGSVFLARPEETHQGWPDVLVVKTLHGTLVQTPEYVSRFRHEAAMAVRLASPHVARVYGAGAVDDVLYIAMEHVQGVPLRELIARVQASGKRLSVDLAVELVLGLLDGLAAIHGATDATTGAPLGFVHRDIKPANIMVAPDGVPHLIDLGLGKSTMQSWRTRTGQLLGTPGYMSPEQVMGLQVDLRTDLFACGVLLFELLTGEVYIGRGPIPEMVAASMSSQYRPPSTLRRGLTPAIDGVVAKALAIEPADRYQTADHMRAGLAAAAPEPLDSGDLTEVVSAKEIIEATPKGDLPADVSAMPTATARSVMFATAPHITTFASADLVHATDPWAPELRLLDPWAPELKLLDPADERPMRDPAGAVRVYETSRAALVGLALIAAAFAGAAIDRTWIRDVDTAPTTARVRYDEEADLHGVLGPAPAAAEAKSVAPAPRRATPTTEAELAPAATKVPPQSPAVPRAKETLADLAKPSPSRSTPRVRRGSAQRERIAARLARLRERGEDATWQHRVARLVERLESARGVASLGRIEADVATLEQAPVVAPEATAHGDVTALEPLRTRPAASRAQPSTSRARLPASRVGNLLRRLRLVERSSQDAAVLAKVEELREKLLDAARAEDHHAAHSKIDAAASELAALEPEDR